MGVHGLWELLAPVGRRVSVETLAGKTLAIDASIWMVQFMKAMRDDKGEMVRNAHLLGFFRRICKLLFLRTKPVFVFDGATPALKRKTVIARRKHRENAQAKIRKTAEKLLLNHLKAMKLKELANDIRTQRELNDAKGKNVLLEEETKTLEKDRSAVLSSHDQVKMDEMLAASLAAEEDHELNIIPASKSDEDVDIFLPESLDDVDPAVLDALPPGLRGQIERLSSKDTQDSSRIKNKSENDFLRAFGAFGGSEGDKASTSSRLVSSIAAEEGGPSLYNASSSMAYTFSEDYENDSDEEMIVPESCEAVDKEVLNSLPISVRLDLFTQMKERHIAENRQKYQKLKKAPEKFSELQIQSYLKAVALRREINQVQKASVGRGLGGVQTSRIASEANREFIFSSSYVGNKELLTSSDQSNNKGKEPQTHLDMSSSNAVSEGGPTETFSQVSGLLSSKKSVSDGVQTFLDERGHIRVSRVRAMGIRMTRDLQRNLDMMKEIERDHAYVNSQPSDIPNTEPSGNINTPDPTRNETIDETLGGQDGKSTSLMTGTPSLKFANASPIQISFEDGGKSGSVDDDDDIFTQLVAGEPVNLSVEKASSSMLSSQRGSYSLQHEKGYSFLNNSEVEAGQGGESNSNDDSEVDWEEGCDIPVAAQRSEPKKSASRGVLEEDADLREAIRRSMDDQMCDIASAGDQQSKLDVEISHQIGAIFGLENDNAKQILLNKVGGSFVAHSDIMDDAPTTHDSDGKRFSEITGFSLDREESGKSYEYIHLTADKPDEVHQHSHSEVLLEDGGNIQDQGSELSGGLNVASETDQGNWDTGNIVGLLSQEIASSDKGNQIGVPFSVGASLRPLTGIDDKGSKADSTISPPANEKRNRDASGELLGSTESKCPAAVDMVPNYIKDTTGDLEKNRNGLVNSAHDNQAEFSRENLEEEIQKLGEECTNLEKEQKKLERNAESVSSEMFVECQELLQMFGIPYLVAPMEAEAQCAFMELENLVDGVVTDDSDVLLFGAKSVYKNIFDDRKYVEMYLFKDIEKELGLTREKLISMALLLGSDYTEGVSGIGIVNAIEIVNAFPEEDGLRKFREWVESPDPAILGKVDLPTRSASKKRGWRASGSEMESEGASSLEALAQEENLPDETEEIKQKFINTHRNVSKNWHFPPNFPSEAVISAYCSPQVDRSTESFSWGKPDLFLLRKLCWEKFGWGNQKADELLIPVLNEYSKQETQLRLEAFYSFNERFAKIRSRRIKKAVKGITKGKSSVLMDDSIQAATRHGKTGSNSPKQNNEMSEDVLGRSEKRSSACHSNALEDGTSMQQRKTKANGKCSLAETGNGSTSNLSSPKQHPGKRARGKGRKAAVTKKKKVEYSNESQGSSGSSDSDPNPSNSKEENREGHKQVRRSGRHRKKVDYSVDGSEDELMKCGSHARRDDETAHGNNQFSTDKHDELPITADRPVRENASSDYLKTGGGFCMDEDNTDYVNNSQDTPQEDNFYQDVRRMDSGFFMNEMEAGGVPENHGPNQGACDQAIVRPVSVAEVYSAVPDGIEKQTDGSHTRPEMESGDAKTKHDYGSNVPPEGSSVKDHPPIAAYGSLKAMPILRRKRRKT
ncbi:hypothetical protein MLD38_033934 [Melastoma candidum]|uniref:Uncharacterized protein n=1 Tax=Melastoma candidum TaxID=119954 RepID=A0ACB9MA78_9MYRT|nr:hypothetical protein MLD38_033934 [Melastoma candidum]